MSQNRTYQKIGLKVHFRFDYDAGIVEAIKEISWKERVYVAISKEWVVNLTSATQPAIVEIIEKFSFIKSTEPIAESSDNNVEDYIKKRSRLKFVKSFTDLISTMPSGIKPYKFQEEDIDYMCSWGKMINGNDMGLGKSVETIFSTEITNRFPCLLICPSSTKYQWKELWHKVNKDRSISILDSKSDCDWGSDVVIINYDMLGNKEFFTNKDGEEDWRAVPKFPELLSVKWRYIVLDEIHWVKHSKSLRSKTLKLITKGVENIHGLTGTLVENRPSELMNPLNLIGVFQDIFGGWGNFTTRYCDAKETRYGKDISGSSNELELHRLLRETCYIRKEKRDVLQDLPDIQTSVLDIDIDNLKMYCKAEDSFIEYMEENFSKMKVDSALMAQFLVQRDKLRQLSVVGKIKGIKEWLEDFIEQSTEKVLIVGNYTEPLQKLSEYLSCEIIDGSKDAFQKRELIKNWSTNKKQFMLGNIRAVGTGTDGLQDSCSTLVIIDLPDKPSTLDQLISRLERIGQKNAINVYFLLSQLTIDMHLWEVIEAKRQIMEAINKGKKVEQIDINTLLIKSYLKR